MGYRFVGAVQERQEVPTAAPGLAPVAARPDVIPGPADPARLPGEDSAASSTGARSAAQEFPKHRVPGGERKLVTLLGCALAQATTGHAQADLDALHGEMRTLFTLAQEMVDRYGG